MLPYEPIASKFAESAFASAVVDTQPLRIQSSHILSHFLHEIGLHAVVDRWCRDEGEIPASKILEAYIHCRFNSAKPVPLSRFEEWVGQSYVPQLIGVPSPKFNEYRLGRVIEAAGPNAQAMWREIIANAHRRFKFDLSYVINDTTSFYFEGEYTDSDLAKYGYSRDGKPDCKQVNVNLNVTGSDAIPIMYEPLPGNTVDSSTVIRNAEQLRKMFGVLQELSTKIVVVQDRGLLTRQAVHYYKNNSIGFTGCMLATNDEKAAILAVPDEELRSSPLEYLPERLKHRSREKQEEERYFAVRRTVTLSAFTDDQTKTKYPALEVDGLVVLASGKARLDRQKREDHLSKVEARLQEISTYLNTGKYQKVEYAAAQIEKAISRYPAVRRLISYKLSTLVEGDLALQWNQNDQEIRKAAQLDGKYVVFTTETHLTDNELFRQFKSRDRVEKRVECVKGPIQVRPIYLHKDERILGLIFSNMVPLLIYGLIEMQSRRAGIKVTGEEIQKLFGDYGASLLTFSDGSQVVTLPLGDKWQQQIVQALGVRVQPVQRVTAGNVYQSRTASACPWDVAKQDDNDSS